MSKPIRQPLFLMQEYIITVLLIHILCFYLLMKIYFQSSIKP